MTALFATNTDDVEVVQRESRVDAAAFLATYELFHLVDKLQFQGLEIVGNLRYI